MVEILRRLFKDAEFHGIDIIHKSPK